MSSSGSDTTVSETSADLLDKKKSKGQSQTSHVLKDKDKVSKRENKTVDTKQQFKASPTDCNLQNVDSSETHISASEMILNTDRLDTKLESIKEKMETEEPNESINEKQLDPNLCKGENVPLLSSTKPQDLKVSTMVPRTVRKVQGTEVEQRKIEQNVVQPRDETTPKVEVNVVANKGMNYIWSRQEMNQEKADLKTHSKFACETRDQENKNKGIDVKADSSEPKHRSPASGHKSLRDQGTIGKQSSRSKKKLLRDPEDRYSSAEKHDQTTRSVRMKIHPPDRHCIDFRDKVKVKEYRSRIFHSPMKGNWSGKLTTSQRPNSHKSKDPKEPSRGARTEYIRRSIERKSEKSDKNVVYHTGSSSDSSKPTSHSSKYSLSKDSHLELKRSLDNKDEYRKSGSSKLEHSSELQSRSKGRRPSAVQYSKINSTRQSPKWSPPLNERNHENQKDRSPDSKLGRREKDYSSSSKDYQRSCKLPSNRDGRSRSSERAPSSHHSRRQKHCDRSRSPHAEVQEKCTSHQHSQSSLRDRRSRDRRGTSNQDNHHSSKLDPEYATMEKKRESDLIKYRNPEYERAQNRGKRSGPSSPGGDISPKRRARERRKDTVLSRYRNPESHHQTEYLTHVSGRYSRRSRSPDKGGCKRRHSRNTDNDAIMRYVSGNQEPCREQFHHRRTPDGVVEEINQDSYDPFSNPDGRWTGAMSTILHDAKFDPGSLTITVRNRNVFGGQEPSQQNKELTAVKTQHPHSPDLSTLKEREPQRARHMHEPCPSPHQRVEADMYTMEPLLKEQTSSPTKEVEGDLFDYLYGDIDENNSSSLHQTHPNQKWLSPIKSPSPEIRIPGLDFGTSPTLEGPCLFDSRHQHMEQPNNVPAHGFAGRRVEVMAKSATAKVSTGSNLMSTLANLAKYVVQAD